MRYLLITPVLALCMWCSTAASAQSYFELGVQGGDMPYNGDLSDNGLGFLKDWNTYGGFYLRYRPISRVGLRFNGIFGRIEAEREATLRVSNTERALVEQNFRSRIQEFSLAAEVDLFYLGDPEDRFVAPYLMVGVGRTAFNPQARLPTGVYVDLQPLRTEAQGNVEGNYDPTPYALNITTYHVGGGLRAKLGERVVVGGEVSGRVTGTDYLDDVTGRQLVYQDILSNPGSLNGAQAARIANPGVEPGDPVDDLTFRRGGDSDDFYFLINLTVGIRLGGWSGGRGGSGCYSF